MKQRILSAFLAIVMVVCMLPMSTVSVVAADFSYVDESNTVQSAENCTAITSEMNQLSSGWYIVESDMTISSRLDIVGTVNLILADGVTLTVGAGIHLPQGNTLKIYGQAEGTGALVSGAWTNLYASIGGNYQYQNTDKVGENCGDLYIYGGNITATGSGGGAGIEVLVLFMFLTATYPDDTVFTMPLPALLMCPAVP